MYSTNFSNVVGYNSNLLKGSSQISNVNAKNVANSQLLPSNRKSQYKHFEWIIEWCFKFSKLLYLLEPYSLYWITS
jgi:hypothetical protein